MKFLGFRIFAFWANCIYNFIFFRHIYSWLLTIFHQNPHYMAKAVLAGWIFIFQLVSNPKKMIKGPPPGGYSITQKCRPLCHANVLVHNSCFCIDIGEHVCVTENTYITFWPHKRRYICDSYNSNKNSPYIIFTGYYN